MTNSLKPHLLEYMTCIHMSLPSSYCQTDFICDPVIFVPICKPTRSWILNSCEHLQDNFYYKITRQYPAGQKIIFSENTSEQELPWIFHDAKLVFRNIHHHSLISKPLLNLHLFAEWRFPVVCWICCPVPADEHWYIAASTNLLSGTRNMYSDIQQRYLLGTL